MSLDSPSVKYDAVERWLKDDIDLNNKEFDLRENFRDLVVSFTQETLKATSVWIGYNRETHENTLDIYCRVGDEIVTLYQLNAEDIASLCFEHVEDSGGGVRGAEMVRFLEDALERTRSRLSL